MSHHHPRTLALLILFGLGGCAHGGGEPRLEPARPGVLSSAPGQSRLTTPRVAIARVAVGPTSRPSPVATRPSAAERLALLRRMVERELSSPELASSRLSLLVVGLPSGRGAPRGAACPASRPAASRPADPSGFRPAASRPADPTGAAGAAEPIVAVEVDAHRLPASNAKLLTTLAAAVLLPGKYRFVTEVSRSAGGPIYLWGTGDPVLRGADLVRLASVVRGRGGREVRGIVVDDSHFGRERMAPGFEAFSEGSFYRPTSSAVNVDGNAVEIKVSAPADRPKRPRIDVTPPSDYVSVRKLVRYGSARRCPEACESRIKVSVQARASRLLVTVSGIMGRKAPPFHTRRAVPDPSLNAGWALRRALTQAGIKVTGAVRRGRRPAGAALLARREHSLVEVLTAANQHSDNLAAETLVRVMSFLPDPSDEDRGEAGKPAPAGSWSRGLQQLRRALQGLGLSAFAQGNGSGLHRRGWVTARTLVQLLQTIQQSPTLSKLLLPTLAVAGRSGTLAPRLRGGAAEGHLLAKTGTLGGALALSGLVDPQSDRPLAFSLLVNGRSDRVVRERMDRIAELLARYARGLALEDPASQPDPQTAAASQPAAAGDE